MNFGHLITSLLILHTVKGVVNDLPTSSNNEDTYISAYMDSKYSTTEQPVGVVYPESDNSYVGRPSPQDPSNSNGYPEYRREPNNNIRQFGPEPGRPFGPPFGHTQFHHQPPIHPYSPQYHPSPYYHHPHGDPYLYNHSPFYGVPPYPPPLFFPPGKFAILAQIGGFFITIVKLFLKSLVIKMILKLFIIFAAFFILPKLSLLTEHHDTEDDDGSEDFHHHLNSESADEPVEQISNKTFFNFRGYNNTKLNELTKFVMNAIEGRGFLDENKCDETGKNKFCKIQKALTNFEKNLSIQRIFKILWNYNMK